MEKTMNSNIGHYFKHLTCTLFVVLGLLGIFAPASQAATGAFAFSTATQSVDEGAGKVNIIINRVGGSTGAASVSFRTNQISAVAGSDFVNIPLTTLNFAHREKQKIVSVNIINDTIVDPGETFEVLLSNPTYGTTLGKISSSVLTIQDDDIASVDTTAPTVSITSPANATTFTSAQTVTIAASALDNVGVSKVELYDGATLMATDTTSPYSFAWTISNANNGNHSLTAKAYDAAGNNKISSASAVTVNIPVATVPVATAVYETPVLKSVSVSNGNYQLAWSLPTTAYGVPAGGYDIFVDGVDDNLNHTSLSATKSGLPLDIEHCFVVEARWTQASPSVFASSNKVCVQGTQSIDAIAPTVSLTSPANATTFTSAQTVTITASASDNVGVSKVEIFDGATLKGTDATAPYSFTWAITEANNGNHNFTAKAFDAAGNVTSSTPVAINVNIAIAVPVYETPVLKSVTVSNGSYLLAWTLPTTAYGVPAGGYDVFTDGVDDNLNHTTLSTVKSGLPLDVEHCFVVEARWTQAAPSVFAASNTVCVQGTQSTDSTAPTAAITSPASGTTLTSAQTVTVTASAADNIGVSKVELYDGANLKATDTTAPYSFAWAITSANNGSHSLTVKAYDAAGNSKTSSATAVTVNIAAVATNPGSLKVFPGAEGYGANTKAGRGGQVIKVTNLNDSGPGSFRAAVQATYPRIVVFEVAGAINLTSQLWISSPYITIAGQTAPAPGIVLTGSGLRIATHDLLMQHIFVRHTASDGTDAIDVRYNGSVIPYNIVIDHVSVSWGDDENLSFAPGGTSTIDNNVTYSNNIIAEGNGSKYGTLISDGTKKLSAIRNLWMSNYERQPRVKGGATANLVNNISYNVGTGGSTVVGSPVGANNLSFAGNLYLRGPSTPSGAYGIGAASDIAAGSKIYLSDNIATGNLINDRMSSYLVNSPPAPLAGISVLPSSQVEDYVFANAGARPGERDGVINSGVGDPVDERLISEAKSGGGSIKSSPYNMPVIKSTTRSFQVPSNPNGDDDGDGYTNIEEVLYQHAIAVE